MSQPNLVNFLTSDVRAVCDSARQLSKFGKYQEAEAALSGFWDGVGHRPYVHGLPDNLAAELYLLTGSLNGHLGRSRGIAGSTEGAKNLLTRSREICAALGDPDGEARALSEIGYWCVRERAHGDAEIYLTEALAKFAPDNFEDRAQAAIRLVAVELKRQRTDRAIAILREHHAPLRATKDLLLRLTFHMEFAAALCVTLATTGDALVAYESLREGRRARQLAEELNHQKFLAHIENNSALALAYLGIFDDAHRKVNRAIEIDEELKQPDLLISHLETRARIFMAEGKLEEAERIVADIHSRIDEAEQAGLFAEIQLCAGEIAAHRGDKEEARTRFLTSLETAERGGDLITAERAQYQLDLLSNLRRFPAAARTFRLRMGNDSLSSVGVYKGVAYEFRRTRTFKDGDVVAALLRDRLILAVIYPAPHSQVRLEWPNTKYKPRYCPKSAVKVLGVIEYEEHHS